MNGGISSGGALKGIRVVDFGQYLAAPMVAMFLADNGADVIHIDPPEGPRWDHPANAALYRGKRSVSLDLKTSEGLAKARRLAESADIVLENFRPGVMDRLGIGAKSVAAKNPRVIWCSIPGFASDDPRADLPAWEGVVCSASGLYPAGNFRNGDPVFTALPLASNYGAFVASHRISAALLERSKTGAGQIIEVSLYEACFQGIGFYAEMPASRDFVGTLLARVHPVMKMREAADGNYIYFDSPLRGLQELLDRFLPGRQLLKMSGDELAEVSQELDDLILSKTGAEWERICQKEVKGAFGLVQNLPDWLADAHARESETVVSVDDAEYGQTTQAGFPVLLSHSRPSVRWGRGKQEAAVNGSMEWFDPLTELPAVTKSTDLPLSGLRVIDCSSLLAGPTTARVLAQYGAEVIKIDRVEIANGEFNPLSDDEVAFIGARTVSAGKRMMYLDLKDPRGQAVLHEMVKTADVVHHNFTPKAAEKLGIDSPTLRGINGSVIVSTMSLHSHGGFRAEYRGHDMLGQMITGMGHRAGGSGDPQVASTYLNDNASGHLHAFGVMLALMHRDSTGEGQDVNCALSRTATLHQLPYMIGYEGRVWDEPAGPEARGWGVLDRLYRAADGWFYLAAPGAKGRESLDACSLVEGTAGLDDDALAALLEAKFATTSLKDCVAGLLQAGISAQPHYSLIELADDAYVADHGLLTAVEHTDIGPALGIGLKVYGDQSREARVLATRRPGMDTVELLQEHGFSAEIGPLLQDKIVAIGEAAVLNATKTKDYWGKVQFGQPTLLGGLEPSEQSVKILNEAQPFPTEPIAKT